MEKKFEKIITKIKQENQEGKETRDKNLIEYIKEFQKNTRFELSELENTIEGFKKQMVPKEKIEFLELKLEGEKIYQNYFVEKLSNILNHKFEIELKNRKEKVVLRETIENWLKKFSNPEFANLSLNQKSDFQKEFLRELVAQINKIPSGRWSIDFEKTIKTGRINCSCCSALLGLILESTKEATKIKNIEYGLPVGHAVNVVDLINGRTFLLDSREGIIEELTKENTEIKQYNNLKIYEIREMKGKRVYQIIPVLPLKEGVLVSYLGNLGAAYICYQEKIPESWKNFIREEDLKEYKKQKKFQEAREQLQKEGKELFKEKELSEKRIQFLPKIRDIFAGSLENYKKTESFQKEIKRYREIYYKKEEKKKEMETFKRSFLEKILYY